MTQKPARAVALICCASFVAFNTLLCAEPSTTLRIFPRDQRSGDQGLEHLVKQQPQPGSSRMCRVGKARGGRARVLRRRCADVSLAKPYRSTAAKHEQSARRPFRGSEPPTPIPAIFP
jgi:hypothetical protein